MSNKRNVLVKNGSKFPMILIYNHLAGYEAELRGLISIVREPGSGYDTIYVSDVKK